MNIAKACKLALNIFQGWGPIQPWSDITSQTLQ